MKPLLPIALAGCMACGSVVAANPAGADTLSAAEKQAVAEAAKKSLEAAGLWKGKVYLTNSEVAFDHRATPPDRYALLTFYRYDGNLAILATVHIERKEITKIATHPHMPTSLSAEEIAEAARIARANPEVQTALAKYKHLNKIEIDTAVAVIIDAQAPGFQHRVARLFFRDGQRNYLQYLPMVDVDLTTGDVRFEPVRGIHERK